MSTAILPPLDENQRYSVPESSAYLRTCRAKIYQKIKSGELRIIKDGARTLIPGSEIIRLSTLSASVAA